MVKREEKIGLFIVARWNCGIAGTLLGQEIIVYGIDVFVDRVINKLYDINVWTKISFLSFRLEYHAL